MSRKKYKFRFADMMPNAWFYKLKNNSSHHPIIIKNHHHQLFSTISSPNHPTIITQSAARTSYYYTRQQVPTFIPDHNPPPPPILHTSPTNPKPSEETHSHPDDEPPRKSFEKTRSTKRRTTTSSPFSSPSSSSSSSSSFLVASSVSDGCSFRSTLESVSTKSNSTPDYSGSCSSPSSSSSVADENSNKKIDVFDCLSELGQLPQIVTKPDKFSLKKTKETTEPTKIRTTSSAKSVEKNVDHGSLSVKIVQQDRVKKPGTLPRRSFHSSNSPGLKLRSNSPRIVTRKSNTIQARRRKMITTTTTTKQSRISSSERRKKNHSDSFAIIKSSYNPQEDFRESMEEMIIENNLTTSSDLEELLASYLSLNSDEYHDIIVKVFRHVWFDLIDNS